MSITKIIGISFILLVVSGCSSNNIKSYKVDPSLKASFQHHEIKKTNVQSVTKSKDDLDSILCRMVGNIYLPQKMKYSEYVKDALNKSLVYITEHSTSEASHNLNVVLDVVDVNTIAGEWKVDGHVTVDQNSPVKIETVTKFGTAYIAETACRNAAESFDEAVANFINKTLTNQQIINQLK